jgi:hypothetical protein
LQKQRRGERATALSQRGKGNSDAAADKTVHFDETASMVDAVLHRMSTIWSLRSDRSFADVGARGVAG